MMKILLIGVGTISVVLGVIGIFLPLIPTTPFVLLAGACYLRSSEKHHQRLLANPWLGPYLKEFASSNKHRTIFTLRLRCGLQGDGFVVRPQP
ncbi:MAG: YbaN family protein [Desulfitobacterium sp.]